MSLDSGKEGSHCHLGVVSWEDLRNGSFEISHGLMEKMLMSLSTSILPFFMLTFLIKSQINLRTKNLISGSVSSYFQVVRARPMLFTERHYSKFGMFVSACEECATFF